MRRAWWLAAMIGLVGCHWVFDLEPAPTVDAPLPQGNWLLVSGGTTQTCGIRLDGTLWCWGMSYLGGLGLGTTPQAGLPAKVGGATWSKVSTGTQSTCGIDAAGALWCWGENSNAQLGLGDSSHRNEPTLVSNETWTAVAMGDVHACAIRADRTLWCWGYNGEGALGDTTMVPRSTPNQVAGSWLHVAVGSRHTCAIRDDNSLWCFGSNSYAQLGDPSLPLATLEPAQIGTLQWKAVAAGWAWTCGLLADGEARCFGDNSRGQLGTGNIERSTVPVPVNSDVRDWTQLVAGWDHACGLRADNTVLCWGNNARRQIASTNAGDLVLVPMPITGGAGGWTQLGLGRQHTCVVGAGSELWCVGGDSAGQLGRGGGNYREPVQVPGAWKLVAAGKSNATCALDDAGVAHCWGTNNEGQLGDGTPNDRATPTRVTDQGSWDDIQVGFNFSCALRGSSRACWGVNSTGQLADNTVTSRRTPTFRDDYPWQQIALGYSHTCGIDTAGKLYCWGYNALYQLGLGDTAPRLVATPTATTLANEWKTVRSGQYHSCALDTLGALYCWGTNSSYQFGNGSAETAMTAALAQNGPYDKLAIGDSHGCAIDSSGIAMCWGNNVAGQVGVADAPGLQMTPIALGDTWATLSLGTFHSCGIKLEGTLWCWGSNLFGRLGTRSFDDVASPTQVGTENTWTGVSAGATHTCATKAVDRSLWCWGSNLDGQIGDGSAWKADFERVLQ